MADVTLDRDPLLRQIGTSQQEIALNSQRLYVIEHTGLDASGSASSNTVYAQTDGDDVTASHANGTGKIAIQAGGAYPLPAGCESVKLKTSSGNASVQIYASEFDHRRNVQ